MRCREGYTIRSFTLKRRRNEGQGMRAVIKLWLSCTLHVRVEYAIVALWPLTTDKLVSLRIDVDVVATHSFLHLFNQVPQVLLPRETKEDNERGARVDCLLSFVKCAHFSWVL